MDTTAPTSVSEYIALEGATTGTVTVVDGGTLNIVGRHDGTVLLEGGAALRVAGSLHGTLEIGSLATATVTGDVTGQIVIRVAGTLVVEPDGRVAGPVMNYGSYTNRGMRGSHVEGREPDDQAGAVTAEPAHPGIYNYVLPEREG